MVRLPAPRLPLPQRQSGVAVLYGFGALIAMTSAMALTFDIGQLYLAQQDLNKMAETAAADAARVASGCYTTGAPSTLSAATTAVVTSLTNNLQYSVREGGAVPTAAQLMQTYGYGQPTVQFGTFTPRTVNGAPTRSFLPLAATDPGVDSVQVNLARVQPTPLIPFFSLASDKPLPGNAPVMLHASASAQQSPVAAFNIRSSLATISLPVACALLAPAGATSSCININAVNSTDLADATVTLGGIAAALGLGNADTKTLLNTQLPLGTALQAIADNLTQTGQTAAASAVGTLATFANSGQVVVLGMVLGTVPGASGVISSLPIDVPTLFNALLVSANGGFYPIKLPVSTSIPGVTLSAFLSVGNVTGDPNTCPDSANGKCARANGAGRAGMDTSGNDRTTASTSQILLQLRIGIGTQALPLISALPVVGNAATINLGIDVTGATATSFLASLNCPAPLAGKSQPSLTIPVTAQAASITIGTFTGSSTAAAPAPLRTGTMVAVGGNLLTANLGGLLTSTVGNNMGSTLVFDGPFYDTDHNTPIQQSQSISLVAPNLTSAVAQLAGTIGSNLTVSALNGLIPIPAGSLVSGILGVLGTPVPSTPLPANPLAGTSILGVADNLLSGLGFNVAGATVTVTGVAYGTDSGLVASNNLINSQPVVFNKTKPGYEQPVTQP